MKRLKKSNFMLNLHSGFRTAYLLHSKPIKRPTVTITQHWIISVSQLAPTDMHSIGYTYTHKQTFVSLAQSLCHSFTQKQIIKLIIIEGKNQCTAQLDWIWPDVAICKQRISWIGKLVKLETRGTVIFSSMVSVLWLMFLFISFCSHKSTLVKC